MNLIRQINTGTGYEQKIKMVVCDNERGPKGDKGDTGIAANITAGEAYSVPSNQQPAVVNIGSASDAIFDFYIPKGDKGDQGIPGKDGVVQYTAGAGIRIKDNVISVIGGGGGDVEWGDIKGTIADQTDLQTEFAKYTESSNLATVATTGSYDDLLDKPTIPEAQVNSDWNAVSGVAEILNKPTIPTVNDSTITLTQNSSSVGSFTTNSSTSQTINFTTPVITMQTTDPGEGATLATDHFIAVFSE